MTSDPRGRWFRVYSRQVRQHPKFRDLNVTELGVWLALRAEADLRTDAAFADEADALFILRRRKTPKPAAMLERMVDLRLFDRHEDGSIAVHDRDENDRQTYPSDDPEETRRRKAEERARKAKNRDGAESRTESRDVTNGHEPHAHAPSQPASSPQPPTNSRQPADAPAGEILTDLPDESDPVTEACRLLPNGGQWLSDLDYRKAWDDLVRRFGDEWVLEALKLGYQSCLKRGRVRPWDLKRMTEWHLAQRNRADELAAEKAEKERIRAEAEAHQRALEEAAPEIQERAKLQQQAIRLGIELGLVVPTDPDEVRKFVMKYGSAA